MGKGEPHTIIEPIFEYIEYLNLTLLLDVYEHLSQWRTVHLMCNVYMLMKMHTIELVITRCIIKLYDVKGKELPFPSILQGFTFSCSPEICSIIQPVYLDSLRNDFNDELDVKIASHTKSTADRIYYAQALIFKKQIEKAISILNGITESEGDFFLSVFICPKSFWEFNFLDDNLCKELSKYSFDYFVIPTNLYARYLLVNAYNSLGQMEQCERNMNEFCILRQLYSSVKKVAQMLDILSSSFNY